MTSNFSKAALAVAAFCFLTPGPVHAEQKKRERLVRPTASFVRSFGFDKREEFFAQPAKAEVVDVSKEVTPDGNQQASQPGPAEAVDKLVREASPDENTKRYKPVYDSDSPDKKIEAWDKHGQISINPEASGPGVEMVKRYQQGDMRGAGEYAKQWVKYQQTFSYTVRDLTTLIGKALIDQGEIEEDEWLGVPQLIDYEMAKTRAETGATLFKPRHETAMQRVEPDPKNEAMVYFFFTMNCSWCRKMAPDLERLWRVTQNDPRVKLVALTMGPTPKDWVDEYRKYTGLNVPVLQGDKVAKAFGVRFVPAIVIVTPNSNKAYLKTGQQTFERLYDFVRRAQGLPATFTPEIQQVMKTPIGQAEVMEIKKIKSEDGGNAVALKTPAKKSGKNGLDQF